jgi:peptide/nickel transport system permease protein
MSSEAQQHQVELPVTVGADTPAPAGGAGAPGAMPPAQGVYVASQWKLMWWKFKRHKLAMIGGVIVIVLYLVAAFSEFLAPFDPNVVSSTYTYAPPQRLHLFDRSGGGLEIGLYVYGYKSEIDQETLSRTFSIDESTVIPVRFFAEGHEYKLLGLLPTNRHLIGPSDPNQPMYLLGADRLGQDLLSRIIYGTRISMSIGLVGVAISLVLGIILGGISGYFGGGIDTIIQRVIEFLRSIPTIPLWMGLAAALPLTWSPIRVYFGITVILSVIGWTGLARVVRGRFLSLREEEFVTAARLDGASKMRIMAGTWCHPSPATSLPLSRLPCRP